MVGNLVGLLYWYNVQVALRKSFRRRTDNARLMTDDSSRISPTAHFTGYVWYRHGLGDPALQTRAGKLLVTAFSPIDRAVRWAGGPNLEDVLLSRHRLIDDLLERAISAGEVGQ